MSDPKSIEPRGGGAEYRQHADAGVEGPANEVPGESQQAGAEPAISCPNAAHMGEFACANRSQCWEPCGELGKDPAHARRASPEDEAAVERALNNVNRGRTENG